MFGKKIYIERRELLAEKLKSGLILFMGNVESPINYSANTYHFRQDSNFLYFFGQDKPGLLGLIDIEERKDYLFGEDFSIDDIIWMGPQPTVKELAQEVGVNDTGTLNELEKILDESISKGRKIHFSPPYRAENSLRLQKLTGISPSIQKKYASLELIKAIVEQRSVKSKPEITEIEKALDISYKMYQEALRLIRPGAYEYEIVGKMEGIVGSSGGHISFPTILSVHGETLHNHYHGNLMKKNDLVVIDSGAESPEYYASDITRTFPVGGVFTPEQKDIYEIVLNSQLEAIKSAKPGKRYKEVHLKVAKVIASGLKDMGLIKGEVEQAVKAGAHALFFPHGLGHMLGLDVHDMEDLGENFVGYDEKVSRSDQFGLAYLRLGRKLLPNFVFTVEPGIYFIPVLIEKWKSENKLSRFINYAKVEKFKDFGGIRIEDNIMVTEKGSRVLGKPIPKTVAEIESIMK